MAEPVVLGLLASPGLPYDLAMRSAEPVAEELRARHPDVEWEVVVAEPPVAVQTAGELQDVALEEMRLRGWEMAVGLTDLPLRSGRRPVAAHASAQHRVGLVSVPALGAVRLAQRVPDAIVNVVEGILGEGVRPGGENRGRAGRMAGRLRELASPLSAEHLHDEGTIRVTTAVVRGNLRLLVGMVRANNPWLVTARLSRVLAIAGGTAAYALTSNSVWLLADGSTWLRLLLVSVGTLAAGVATLIVAHHLWEKAQRPEEREPVVLFNLATTATVTIGIATLYLALVLISLAAGYALIPQRPFAHTLAHPVGFGDYVQLAFLSSAVASLAGALGSLTESDFAVREAMYRYQPDERTEAEVAA